jgi:hypothetical protein
MSPVLYKEETIKFMEQSGTKPKISSRAVDQDNHLVLLSNKFHNLAQESTQLFSFPCYLNLYPPPLRL